MKTSMTRDLEGKGGEFTRRGIDRCACGMEFSDVQYAAKRWFGDEVG